jgi:hypothetical protein
MSNGVKLFASVFVLGLFSVLSPVLAEDGGRPIAVPMTGAEEPNGGDTDGSGEAVFFFNPGLSQVCFQLTVRDIAPATAAHIHLAPAGVNGSVVIGLVPPTDGFSSGCVTADRDLLKAILQDPAAYYVNVHNADFPGGAVRGQLAK